MPPKGSGKWPATEAENRDHDNVLELLERVGQQHLRFSVYHIHQEIRRTPRLALEIPSQLSRHLRALEGKTIVRVEGRNAGLAAPAEGPAPGARYAKHMYVAAGRLKEYLAATPELDSLERGYHALHVAVASLGLDAVPTIAVTRVLQSFPELAVTRLTGTLLSLLADRRDPLVERRAVEDERWVRWAPVGPAPTHPDFARWVEEFRALNSTTTEVVGSGHASLNEMVREIIEIAVRSRRSEHWPYGHPVTIGQIRTTVGEDPRARELSERLLRLGTSFGAVLGDVSRRYIAGSKRVLARVVKVPSAAGGKLRYDVPSLDGFERRAAFVAYEDFKMVSDPHEVERWVLEHRGARRVYEASRVEQVRAVGAIRMLAAHHQLDRMKEAADQLLKARLTPIPAATVEERLMAITRTRQSMGTTVEALHRAQEHAVACGHAVDEILAADRPLIAPTEYASWFPARRLEGKTAAQFVALTSTLGRYPNPDHTERTDSDPDRAALTWPDRVEALVHAAESLRSPMHAFFRAGHQLLGRTMRHPGILRELFELTRKQARIACLAALALLGDEHAVDGAYRILDEEGVSDDEVVGALYSLLVLQRLDPERIPTALRFTRGGQVQRTIRDAVLAARQKRWLLQPAITTDRELLRTKKAPRKDQTPGK